VTLGGREESKPAAAQQGEGFLLREGGESSITLGWRGPPSNAAKPSIFLEASRSAKMRRRGLGARLTLGWRGPPSNAALSPIYSPQREKPKVRIAFPRNILQVATVARSGGSRSSSRHPAGEGNPCRRPSPPPWSPSE
jgi:hypothetical protein